MQLAKFEYRAYLYGDHVIVSILIVREGSRIEVGSLIFNDPEYCNVQYRYWSITMHWSDHHVFIGETRGEQDAKVKCPSNSL